MSRGAVVLQGFNDLSYDSHTYLQRKVYRSASESEFFTWDTLSKAPACQPHRDLAR
jgi:hypothetical protein